MTEHYTEQEAIELARECGFDIGSGITERVHVCTTGKVHDLINAAVTRKLAEKELEVLKLLEALEEVSALINESCGVYGLHLNGDPAPWDELLQGGRYERLGLLQETLSTPSSTKHLDEYVAGKVKPLEVELNQWIANSRENKWIAEQMAEPYKRDIADLTAKLAAAEERVRELEECDKLLSGLRDLCGYVEDGSCQTVRIFQDDAPYDWFVSTGPSTKPVTLGAGRSFHLAIKAAIERSE